MAVLQFGHPPFNGGFLKLTVLLAEASLTWIIKLSYVVCTTDSNSVKVAARIELPTPGSLIIVGSLKLYFDSELLVLYIAG